tara:strand:- start:851 stop:1072 length:222 start_codon:yes stop_codon:yes gene_type:complete
MQTKKFAIDANERRIHEGSKVLYKHRVWILQAIETLTWNRNQYLTLIAPNDKIKKMRYINPKEVTLIEEKAVY